MQHLKNVLYMREQLSERYPFNLPLFRDFEQLTFTSPVTLFVGENGSGKSTLLEALAAAIGSITIGDSSIEYDPTMAPARELAGHLKLHWSSRTKRGFFLRAEDFLNYTKRLSEMRSEATARLAEIKEEYHGRSRFAQSQASLPYLKTLGELRQLYGQGLDARSHGESFFDLFQSRFRPNSLYLLDEPETPLSPLKQLSFISMIKEMVNQNAQFIIATHSPILMAIPGADIYSFDQSPPLKVNYEDVEHVQLTKSFLDNPDSYLRHL